ncbi:polysaccharide biosynthesis/export family protein [Mucilaginibacter celer]|nr:polysaccharide biosynthesis/export family protein [Mucilaginibacter celer]
MSNLGDTAKYSSKITNLVQPRLQPGDMLSIVITNVDPETSTLLNKGLLPVVNTAVLPGNAAPADAPGYLVDGSGEITFPVVGKVRLEGMTVEEAVGRMGQALANVVKNPIISIKVINFKITVVGEVNKPGVFNIPNSRVNVLEALGMAGDMTVYGRRENVQVIHEENGRRTVTRINLNNADALQSPAYYLQQNDVVYVIPDKLREKQARTDTKTLSIIVAAATVITVIISRLF